MTISANFPNVQPSLLLDFANAQQLPPSVTFTRATSAVYYDGSTTALADQNALLYSQDFSVGSSWFLDAAVLSANSIAAPDGTITASTLSNNASNAVHRLYQSIPVFTQRIAHSFSLYAKYKDHRYISFGLTDQSFYRSQVVVDLLNGTITQNFSDIGSDVVTSAITSVGNGWYRITGTLTPGTSITTNLYFLATLQQGSTFTPGAYVGTGTGFYLWGAQAEQRNASTAYTATTTAPITNYVPVLLTAGGGQPRFNHNPTTSESLGLLIEQQSTNQLTYSQDFSNAAWAKTAATITADTIVAPDGTLTGDKLVCDTTTGFVEKFTNRSIYGFVGQTVTGSVYLKRGEFTWAQVNLFNGASNANRVWVNLATGVIGSNPSGITASITSVGGGWYRVTMTATIQSSGSAFITVALADADADLYTTVANGFSGTYLWGAQLETTGFPTSYTPTTNAAATRAADSAIMTGNNFTSWFNNSEGTLYIEASPQTLTTSSFAFASLTNSTGSNNSIAMYYTGGNVVDVESLVGGSVQYTFLISRGSPPTKVAHGYKVNDSNVALNGTASTADTSCLVPPVNLLTIGTIYDAVSFPCNGTIRKLAYYPIRVTNAQLAALTS